MGDYLLNVLGEFLMMGPVYFTIGLFGGLGLAIGVRLGMIGRGR